MKAWVLLAALAIGVPLSAPASARYCEYWKEGSELRCLATGEAAFGGETLRIRNLSNSLTISFKVQQWFSRCGYPSGMAPTAANAYSLKPGGSLDLSLAAYPGTMPGDAAAYCNEAFVFDCQEEICGPHLVAELSPPTVIATRDCEPWFDGERIRCLSQQVPARLGETVTVVSLSKERTSFAYREWHSVCGFEGTALDWQETYGSLAPGASIRLPLRENTAHHNAALDDTNKCTELILSTCATETRFANCPDLFRATIGP